MDYDDGGDDGDSSDVIEVPSFFGQKKKTPVVASSVIKPEVTVPVPPPPGKDKEEEEEEPTFRAPLPLVVKREKKRPVTEDGGGEEQEERVPAKIIATLSTFDRGKGDPEILEARLKRSRLKVSEEELLQKTPTHVDDSLLTDGVGATVRMYERHSQYTGALRAPVAQQQQQQMEVEEEEDDEDDDEEVDEGSPMYNIEVEMDDDKKQLLIPMRVQPDIEGAQQIDTFQEYSTPDPAARQFEHNMQHIKGREQNIFVEVDSDDVRYQHVTDTLMAPLKSQQFMTFAMDQNLVIPRLPCLTKAEIQAARAYPDFLMGERACVHGTKCTSYLLACKRKKEMPDRYIGLDPFPCKELYYGPQGDRMREAIAAGFTPSEVLNPMPVMCVMCHESVVTKFYKKYDMGVMTTPVHILHGYKVIFNVHGEYPSEKGLLGDKTFKGIIDPFLRYCPDNYEWIPEYPSAEQRSKGIVSVPQRWTEKPCLDFH